MRASLLGILILLCALTLAQPGRHPAGQAAPLPGYRLETIWPAAAHGLGAASAIAAGPQGRLWLLDAAAGSLVALSPDGQKVETRPAPADALDLAPEPGGDIYLGRASPNNPRFHRTVGRYLADGSAAWAIQDEGASGSGVAATAGRVFLTDPLKSFYRVAPPSGGIRWRGRVDGRVSGQMVPRGAARGFPADVDVAPDGTLFASDLLGDAVYAWAPPYLPEDYQRWPLIETSGPWRISVGAQSDGMLLVAVLFSDGLVHVHRPDGELVARFSVPGEPVDLAMGLGGRMHVLDEETGDIRVYAPGAPPTATPPPPDPPRGPGACTLQGKRTLLPARVDRCGALQVRLELDAVCPPGAVVGADIVLIVDTSNSMLMGGRMTGAKDASRRFLAGLDLRHHRVALVTFDDDAKVDQALTAERAAMESAVDALTPRASGTNIYSALRAASDHLRDHGRADALPVMIFLSDGEPTLPEAPEPSTAALVAAERARTRRTYVVTVGLGKFIDSLLMEGIASTPQDFYYAPEVIDLQRIYDRILAVVAGMNITDLLLEDRPAAPMVAYVPGSGAPPPLVVNGALTWNRPQLPEAGLTFTYTLQAREVGRGPAGRASVRYLDADGQRRTYVFPEPDLTVAEPRPTAGPGPSATPPSGGAATATLPPAPAPRDCRGEAQYGLVLESWVDSVGVGGLPCPGCNGQWDSGDYPGRNVGSFLAASGPTFVVRADDGSVLWVGRPQGNPGGPPTARIQLCVPPPYTVTMTRLPDGYQSCPNRAPERVVTADDLGAGRQAVLRFPYWLGCRGLPAPATMPPPVDPPACPDPATAWSQP